MKKWLHNVNMRLNLYKDDDFTRQIQNLDTVINCIQGLVEPDVSQTAHKLFPGKTARWRPLRSPYVWFT